MPRSSNKENAPSTAVLATKAQQLEGTRPSAACERPAGQARKRSFVETDDGGVEQFVGKAKMAIKRGCTEMGIRKYASLSSMTASHQSKAENSGKDAARKGAHPARKPLAEPSSEATIIVLESEDRAVEEEVVLESQITVVEPSSPISVRAYECDDTEPEKAIPHESTLDPKPELEDTYADLGTLLRKVERRCATGLAGGLARHSALSARMRPILVDWLMEVAADYRMHRQTLHLTVQFLDRFLAHTQIVVEPGMLQCYGTACLAIAMKAEEQRVPTLTELTDFSKDAFTRDQLRQAELDVLVALRWRLAVPTLFEFLALAFQRAAARFPARFADSTVPRGYDASCPAATPRRFRIHQFAVACDYADALLHFHDSLRFPASALAAACFYLGTAPDSLDGAAFAQCTGYAFAAVWPAILHAKQLRAVLDSPAARQLRPTPCCDAGARHAGHLQRIRSGELWTYQPHHDHLLPQFEAYFALR
ncbi:Cyclin-A2 [Coemansia sp. RSA 2708]|nr:Cyclin-A2 [Coemansia sp. RSA 2708]